jgi:hypothetical protein
VKLAPALFLSLGLVGCGDPTVEIDVEPVDGYALVALSVDEGVTASVDITLDGARDGEGFLLLRSDKRAPFHVGWFDPRPWTRACEDDPSSATCAFVRGCVTGARTDCDVEGAGWLSSVAYAEEGRALLDDERGSSTWGQKLHYAIVAEERAPRRARLLTSGARVAQIR